jgi:hypothetical protein
MYEVYKPQASRFEKLMKIVPEDFKECVKEKVILESRKEKLLCYNDSSYYFSVLHYFVLLNGSSSKFYSIYRSPYEIFKHRGDLAKRIDINSFNIFISNTDASLSKEDIKAWFAYFLGYDWRIGEDAIEIRSVKDFDSVMNRFPAISTPHTVLPIFQLQDSISNLLNRKEGAIVWYETHGLQLLKLKFAPDNVLLSASSRLIGYTGREITPM